MSSAAQSSASSPPNISRAPRVQAVDALRGFALFGILVVNSAAFASPYYASGTIDPAFTGPVDTAVRFMVAALFESKFYLLFSFLFGYSFTLQIESSRQSGRAHTPAFLRRLLFLLLTGIAHACLLYPGDILTIYALVGLLLIPLRRLPHRYCLFLSLGLITALSTVIVGLGLLDHWAGAPPADPQATAEEVRRALSRYRDGALSTLQFNVEEWSGEIWLFLFLYQGPHALAMFLLGLIAGHKGLLDPGVVPDQTLRWLLYTCAPIGCLGGLALATAQALPIPAGLGTIVTGLTDLTAPSLTAAYAATVILFLRHHPSSLLSRGLAAAGRMALSNYLLQSLICSLLFTGYGSALSGSLSPGITLLFAASLFTAQLLLSSLWLRRYQQGPAECLLRAFTRWQIPRLPRINRPEPAG